MSKRAVALVTIEVLVEVDHDDEWAIMTDQAKEELRKRVVEGKGFFPFRSDVRTIYDKSTVDAMKNAMIVQPKERWKP